MRAIVVADCHGRPELITNALEHCEFEKGKDRLIFAGDIIDIGFHPIECIDVLEDNDAEVLIGNHDLALLAKKSIWPNTAYDDDVEERLKQIKFKIAVMHDDVLVTHAGVNERFWIYTNLVYFPVYDVFHTRLDIEKLWERDSPIWYRPSNSDPPISKFKQVVGHTPPSWLTYSGFKSDTFHTVDPYRKIGYNSKERYRYALIEKGTIRIVDSKEGVDIY